MRFQTLRSAKRRSAAISGSSANLAGSVLSSCETFSDARKYVELPLAVMPENPQGYACSNNRPGLKSQRASSRQSLPRSPRARSPRSRPRSRSVAVVGATNGAALAEPTQAIAVSTNAAAAQAVPYADDEPERDRQQRERQRYAQGPAHRMPRLWPGQGVSRIATVMIEAPAWTMNALSISLENSVRSRA